MSERRYTVTKTKVSLYSGSETRVLLQCFHSAPNQMVEVIPEHTTNSPALRCIDDNHTPLHAKSSVFPEASIFRAVRSEKVAHWVGRKSEI